jgi:hypothetical protein
VERTRGNPSIEALDMGWKWRHEVSSGDAKMVILQLEDGGSNGRKIPIIPKTSYKAREWKHTT